jgi:predicted RNA-binding Zn-ribbon protein involved in translation (DUF1610 family)
MCPRCSNPIAHYDREDSEQEDVYYCNLCGWSYENEEHKNPKKAN